MRRENAKPYIIHNGVAVPAGLRVNETTLRQHLDRLSGNKMRMTPDEARQVGYPEDEIRQEYRLAADFTFGIGAVHG